MPSLSQSNLALKRKGRPKDTPKLTKIAAGLSDQRFDRARGRSEQLGNVANRQA